MYRTCPKCGYRDATADGAQFPRESCPACGVIYRKWLRNLVVDSDGSPTRQAASPSSSLSRYFRLGLFCPLRRDLQPAELAIYLVIWLLALLWGIEFIAMDFRSAEIMNSWFHNINLIIHEAGHVLLMPFGRTLMLLGGSLFQVLLPLISMGAFLVTSRDGFAASMCLWWTGQSMMDVAPYIADATQLRLPLLGGGTGRDTPGTHDWANLLRPRGLLQYDQHIAAAVDTLGAGLLLLALVWGAWMLLLYYRQLLSVHEIDD